MNRHRLRSSIAQSLPFWVETRLLAHALRHGLWRSLARRARPRVYEQQVLTWPTSIPDLRDASEIVRYLREAGVRVREGSNIFYVPPQPGLAAALGYGAQHYPPRSGYKILRDFRGLEEAHYLRPDRQTRLRRRLIGTPREQLITANYLHRLNLAPRIWDVCLFQAGRLSMPTFVVQHIEGTPPDADECSAFLQRLRTALSETELRITIPNWERHKDFRCPGCNDNLLRDATGRLNYIDFQNFSVRDRRRLPASIMDHTTPRSRLTDPPGSHGPMRTAGARQAGTVASRQRFRTIRSVLRERGVELDKRLVLDIGCGTGVMLHHALSAGAWWTVGWEQPDAARQAQAIAVALGFTRLEIVPADLDGQDDVGGTIPDWLRPYLDESVVFVLAGRGDIRRSASLPDLPWRALVYEAQDGEPSADARQQVRALMTRGARLAHETRIRDGGSRERALFLLIREPVAAAASAHASCR